MSDQRPREVKERKHFAPPSRHHAPKKGKGSFKRKHHEHRFENHHLVNALNLACIVPDA